MTKKYRVPEPIPQLPTVSISVKGNKLKVYDYAVYLKNGTEFELFFENPTDYTYKAEIIINGESERHGLVLDPSTRFRLERFMDTDKKFLFDTYSVDNNDQVREIIKDNGTVVVKFYRETKITWRTTNSYCNNAQPFSTYASTSWAGDSNVRGFTSNSQMNPLGNTLNSSNTVNYSAKIETGRVEEGNTSSQNFSTVSMLFNGFADVTIQYKLLPISQMPEGHAGTNINSSDIKSYCPTCGRRLKQGWKFCAGCGRSV